MTTSSRGEPKVEVYEAPALLIGRWLLEHNSEFEVYPASSNGVAQYSKDGYRLFLRTERGLNDPVGLLLGPPLRPGKVKLFWFFSVWDPAFYGRPFIGIISLADTDLLSMKVYGRQHLDLCRRLAEAMAKDLKVNVAVKLVQEVSKTEALDDEDGSTM